MQWLKCQTVEDFDWAGWRSADVIKTRVTDREQIKEGLIAEFEERACKRDRVAASRTLDAMN